jgi:putative membrane protein
VVDLSLASLHHLLAFALFAIFAAEMVFLRPGLSRDTLTRLQRIDAAYGIAALLLFVVGGLRVVYGVRGGEYYTGYWVFWLKIALFIAVGLLSIRPTLRFMRWGRQSAADPAFRVPDAEVAEVRRWMMPQMLLLALIPVVAAMLARGVSY